MARSGGGEGTVTVLFQLPHFFMASFLLGHRGHGGLCPRALAVPRPRQWPCVCRFRTARDAVGARARAAERRRPLPASARVTGAHAGAAPWPVRGESGRGGGGTAAARAAPHGSASRRRSTGRPPRAPRRATGTAGGRRPPPPPVPRRAPPSAHRSTPNLRPPSPPPARPTLSPRSLGRRHAVAADDGTGGRVANSTDTHPHSSSCRRTPRASCVGSCSRVDPPLPQALHSPPPRATVP